MLHVEWHRNIVNDRMLLLLLLLAVWINDGGRCTSEMMVLDFANDFRDGRHLLSGLLFVVSARGRRRGGDERG